MSKNFGKILAGLMLALLWLWSGSAMGAERVLSVGNPEVTGSLQRGEVFTVPVTVDDATGVTGFNVTVEFAAAVLELQGVTGLDGYWLSDVNDSLAAKGRVSVVVAGRDGTSSQNQLFQCAFRVRETVDFSGPTTISLTASGATQDVLVGDSDSGVSEELTVSFAGRSLDVQASRVISVEAPAEGSAFSYGDVVTVPVKVNDPAGLNGFNLKVVFDPKVLEFVSVGGLDGYDLPQVTNGTLWKGEVGVAGGVSGFFASTSLFECTFKVRSRTGFVGDTVISLKPVDAEQPVLSGDTEELIGVTMDATLAPYSLTVAPATYTISGSVVYDDTNSAAENSRIVLRKESDAGWIASGVTYAAANGSFAFSGLYDGSYKVTVTPFNPAYYAEERAVVVSGEDATTGDISLLSPQPLRGQIDGAVPGMRVSVYDGGTRIGTYLVRDDGSFQTASLPPSTSYVLKVEYGTAAAELTSGADGYTGGLDAPLFSIQGNIIGMTEGQQVSVLAVSKKAALQKSVLVQAEADATVGYTLNNLIQSDDYIVSSAGVGLPVMYYNATADFVEATPVVVNGTNATGIDFDFHTPKGVVTGSLVDNGQAPSPPLGVYAFDPERFTFVSTLSTSGGLFELTLTPGTYELFVLKNNGKVFYYGQNGTTQREADAELFTVEDGDSIAVGELDLTECLLTVAGRVSLRSENGDPVAGALVEAVGEDSGSRAMAVTDQDGEYLLSGLCPETYSVRMSPIYGGYGVQRETVVAGEDFELNFIIDTGSELSGAVLDPDGIPVKGALIYLLESLTGQLVGGRASYSNADGRYVIRDIPTGEYSLRVQAPLFAPYSTQLQIGADVEFDVDLVKGAHFKGVVSDLADGSLLPGSSVMATQTGALPNYAVTNGTGCYEMYGVTDGNTYGLMARKEGWLPKVDVGTATTGDGTQVDFELSKPVVLHTVNGTLKVEGTEAMVPWASIILSSVEKKFIKTVSSGSAGVFSFKDVPPGDDYTVTVVPTGDYQIRTWTGLNVPADAFDFQVRAGSAISGSLTWPGSASAFVFLYDATNGLTFVDYSKSVGGDSGFVFSGLDPEKTYKLLAVARNCIPVWYTLGGGTEDENLAEPVSPGGEPLSIELAQDDLN